MKYSWILIVALVGFVVMVLIAILRHKKVSAKVQNKKSFKPLANTVAVRNLPEYKSAEKRYRLLLILASGLFVISLIATAITAARPISVDSKRPEYDNRDIMLCLDVSGSMNEYIKELLDYFSKIVTDFKGQRVGLTIFDGIYMSLTPLTDDYDMLSDLFNDLKDNSSDYSTVLKITNSSAGTSAIGPGLVGCIDSFDKLEEENRSRAIILATDNFAQENQLVTLAQAANYAKRYDIAVYGLSTADWRTQAEIDSANGARYEADYLKEFREATLLTGGAYYAFSNIGNKGSIVVSDLVEKILKQAAARYEGAETLIETDVPTIPIVLTIVSLIAFFVLMWRLSL